MEIYTYACIYYYSLDLWILYAYEWKSEVKKKIGLQMLLVLSMDLSVCVNI